MVLSNERIGGSWKIDQKYCLDAHDIAVVVLLHFQVVLPLVQVVQRQLLEVLRLCPQTAGYVANRALLLSDLLCFDVRLKPK